MTHLYCIVFFFSCLCSEISLYFAFDHFTIIVRFVCILCFCAKISDTTLCSKSTSSLLQFFLTNSESEKSINRNKNYCGCGLVTASATSYWSWPIASPKQR